MAEVHASIHTTPDEPKVLVTETGSVFVRMGTTHLAVYDEDKQGVARRALQVLPGRVAPGRGAGCRPATTATRPSRRPSDRRPTDAA